jgi:hypothetical protein
LLIDARIKELDDWRGKMLARLRALIKKADPEVVEEWKWSVRLGSRRNHLHRRDVQECREADFHERRSLKDPSRLFNSSLKATPGAPSISTRAMK